MELIINQWACKYRVVWIPKYRKKTPYRHLRQYLGGVLHDFTRQKERGILKKYIRPRERAPAMYKLNQDLQCTSKY